MGFWFWDFSFLADYISKLSLGNPVLSLSVFLGCLEADLLSPFANSRLSFQDFKFTPCSCKRMFVFVWDVVYIYINSICLLRVLSLRCNRIPETKRPSLMVTQ